MKITIGKPVDVTEFKRDGTQIAWYEIPFTTENGYEGRVRVLKAGATMDSIMQAVKDAATVPAGLIGLEITGA